MSEEEKWGLATAIVFTGMAVLGLIWTFVYLLVEIYGWSGPVYAVVVLCGMFLATAAVKRWAL